MELSNWLEKQQQLGSDEWATASSSSSDSQEFHGCHPASPVSRASARFATASAEKENADLLDKHGLIQLSFSQSGSFQIQQFLQQASPNQIEKVLTNLLPAMDALVTHHFGNYVGQALIQTLSGPQRLAFLEATQDHLLEWSFHERATYVLQTLALQCSSIAEETIFATAFCGEFRRMALHKYASHALQKLIPHLTRRTWIVKELLGYCRDLALDKYGVCVLKKLVNDPVILMELDAHTLELMQDPYGNYIVQEVLNYWQEEVAPSMQWALKGRVAALSVQKYACNVIIRCVQLPSLRKLIAAEVLGHLPALTRSAPGCSVIKALLGVCDPATCAQLRTARALRRKSLRFRPN